jgi:hypothetical protein
VIPRREVKPKIYQLNDRQTIFVDGVARFDYIKGEGKQPFVSTSVMITTTSYKTGQCG